jgi:hypothetical protein
MVMPVVVMPMVPVGMGGSRRRHRKGADRGQSHKDHLHMGFLGLFTPSGVRPTHCLFEALVDETLMNNVCHGRLRHRCQQERRGCQQE